MAYSKQTWIDYPASDATLITADKLSHIEDGIANADTSASTAQTKANSAYSLAETANNGLGGKVDKVTGKGLSTNDYDNTEKAEVAKVASKVDKVSGKGLSTNDYTDADKAEVAKVTNKANKTTIAELYDANAIYEVGYHVIYNEMLYVCKQDCMNTPPPNEAYWEQVILANEVSSLSQSLSDMKYSDISGIGIFGSRLNTTKLKLKKNGYGKVDFFFEGTIATDLTASQNTIFTIDNTVRIPNMILYGSINGIATQFIMDKTYNDINILDAQEHTTNDKVIISGSWYV